MFQHRIFIKWNKCWSTENLKDKFEQIKEENVILREKLENLRMQSGEKEEKGQFIKF